MRNILRIFNSDAKRLASNVVAVVMIMGLSVLPCLYAWFNILSNWDPYGEESTSNLSVAVATADLGIDLDGSNVNIGDIVVDNLKQNTTIGWVFCDTPEDAINGVYAGDYYACLVIDQDFSEGMVSFLGGDPEHPVIQYYENEKKNAIAPKITGKVKTTVQQEVDKAFVGTMAQVLVTASSYVTSSDSSTTSLTDATLDKMQSLDSDLETALTILDSYIAIMESAQNLIDTTEAMTDELDTMMDTSQQIMNSAQAATNAAENSMGTVSNLVDSSLTLINSQLKAVSDKMDQYLTDLNTAHLEALANTMKTSVDAQQSTLTDTMVQTNADGTPVTNADGTVDAKTFSSLTADNQAVIDEDVALAYSNYSALSTDLALLQAEAAKTDGDVAAISKVVNADIKACQDSLTTLSNDYNNKVHPAVNNTVNAISSSINEVEALVNYSSDAISDVSDILSGYPNALNMGMDSLQESRDAVAEMKSMLEDLMGDVEELEGNDQYRLLMKLIETDPTLVAEFISEPINLNEEPIYAVANNGSATAPFYVILSIWFGALIVAVIIKSKVKPIEGVTNVRNYQTFFGRYIVIYLIGQLQTVITVLGCLWFVGIQCQKPFLFWLACSVTSFAFSFFIYSLVYALGSVGEAAAVICLVIQVAGAGGTFPVEVLPKIFQILYQYMPFAYGMNAVRETIGGMHGWDYGMYLSGLGAYVGVSLLLGLVVAVPYKKLGNLMEESLEKTGCMG